MEFHIVISTIDCQGKELRNAICVERKIVKEQEELLLRPNAKIKQQRLKI
jgi:hypothetical protein